MGDASYQFRHLLETAGTKASISRTGQCLYNSAGAHKMGGESFFGTLKAELLNDQSGRCFASKALAKWLVEDYIDHFYNTVRRHSTLGESIPLGL